ncbi:hypothetical protein PTE31013_04804 [Pandoraea terrigena]|uniref:Uncharacterized protein n=1 Tax=Pandoraea terrigena TaxID=2508292 RepID=A0A5E4YUY5_9BURK|nr:hypothetical protein PTE31013_04804 [Pandoraea terrigena]
MRNTGVIKKGTQLSQPFYRQLVMVYPPTSSKVTVSMSLLGCL